MSPTSAGVAVRDPMTRQLVSAVLTRDGLVVFPFDDAEPAWQRLAQGTVHVLLCEGVLATAQWRARLREAKQSNPALRAVLLKGPQVPEDLDASDFDAVVTLPFRYGPLRQQLVQWGLASGPESSERTAEPSPQASGLQFALPPPVVAPDTAFDAAQPAGQPVEPPGTARPEPPTDPRSDRTRDAAPLPIPPRGDLRAHPAARLFFELRAARYHGKVKLWRWGVHHEVWLRDGFVVSGLCTEPQGVLTGGGQRAEPAPSPTPPRAPEGSRRPHPDGLARLFYQQGRISEALVAQVATLVRERGCSESDALVYLGAATEWECLTAIQARIEAQMVEVLTWTDGTYNVDTADEQTDEPSAAQTFVDPFQLIGRAVRDCLTPDQMLTALGRIHDRYIAPSERLPVHLPALRKHLDPYDPAPLLDGQRTFSQALRHHDAHADAILRWLYVLWTVRLIEPSASPRLASSAAAAGSPAQTESARPLVDYSEIARMCDLIGRELARVQQATAAEALGVQEHASTPEVLRAYDEAKQRLSLTSLPENLPPDMRQQATRILDRLATARDALLTDRSQAAEPPSG